MNPALSPHEQAPCSYEQPIVALERRHRAGILRLLGRSSEFRPEELAVAMEVVDAALDGDTSYRCWVAQDARGEAIGYACYGATPLTSWTYDLYWLAVDPAARRLGLGRQLVGRVLERVRRDGGRVVRVETSGKHGFTVSRAFYTSLGFALAGRIADFYGEADDLVIFAARVC